MDTEINKNELTLNKTENYIYRKHLFKYLDHHKNAIKNYTILKNKSAKYNTLITKIQKNKFTEFLFKFKNSLNANPCKL